MAISDFISKCRLKEAFTRASNQYKEYLSEFWYTEKVLPDSKIWVSIPIREVKGEIGITTFRNALRAQYLPHSSMYVPQPSITTVRPLFAMIGYNGRLGQKELLKRVVFWNGYLRKGRKTKPKRQNRTWNGKAWKRHCQVKAQV
ncbi:hypothetical protein Tco_1070414 [Tanacetum coccineum]|uniref:Uncharacterized protein n=1 Tax=Tanacetum coccineum TaxID=301880 RepID=A0ABQ5HLB0_9ASTR